MDHKYQHSNDNLILCSLPLLETDFDEMGDSDVQAETFASAWDE